MGWRAHRGTVVVLSKKIKEEKHRQNKNETENSTVHNNSS